MVTHVETLRRELERLKDQRKSYRILHQRVPKDLERSIANIEAQLTPSISVPVKHVLGSRRSFAGVLWELRYIIGALALFAATAVIYAYY